MSLAPRPTMSRWAGALAGLVSALLLAGCTVPDPEGAGPLRYRDQIFSQVAVTTDQQYGEAVGPGGVKQKLVMDIYTPVGDTAKKRPVALWMHGGGFAVGNKNESTIVELAKRFARRGYVSVSISYRLMAGELCGGETSTERCIPAALSAADDERSAVRYLHKNAAALGIDDNRIGVGGTSAGGVSSVIVGATPETRDSSGNLGYPGTVRAVFSISGAIPTTLIFHPSDAPTYFWHGTADTVVPYAWAKLDSDYMNANGQISVLHDVAGAGHVPSKQYLEDMDSQARNWYYRIMGMQFAEGGGG